MSLLKINEGAWFVVLRGRDLTVRIKINSITTEVDPHPVLGLGIRLFYVN